MFFQNVTHLNKFLNETESSLEVKLVDPNGTDFHKLVMPRVKYTAGDLDNPKEGPIMVTLPFTALADTTASCSLWYQRSNT